MTFIDEMAEDMVGGCESRRRAPMSPPSNTSFYPTLDARPRQDDALGWSLSILEWKFLQLRPLLAGRSPYAFGWAVFGCCMPKTYIKIILLDFVAEPLLSLTWYCRPWTGLAIATTWVSMWAAWSGRSWVVIQKVRALEFFLVH